MGTVVLIEDDERLRLRVPQLIKKRLGEHIKVHEFENHAAAEEWLAKNTCDVVISDNTIGNDKSAGINWISRWAPEHPGTHVILYTENELGAAQLAQLVPIPEKSIIEKNAFDSLIARLRELLPHVERQAREELRGAGATGFLR